MDKTREYKIALVVYTSNLDYDDRIRKEIVSIEKMYPNVKFNIFALYYQNREEEGVTSYGVPYHVYALKARERYASNTHSLLKSWEFFKKVKPELKKYDAVWCADYHVILFPLLLHGKPLLWDLHELPFMLLGNSWGKYVFRFIERKMKVIIHANEPRLKYLHSIGLINRIDKHFAIHNYPDFNEIDSEYDELYYKFDKWLGKGKCVYLQGIHDTERADIESVCSVMDLDDLKAVVVGRINETLRERLEMKYGKEDVNNRLFFTGMLKQLKTPQYARRCILSLVFYKNTNKNNWYCEPNRLFQNIINGNPVVVGNNPPMKELVEKYNVGVCADTDGSDQMEIMKAIKQLLRDYNKYKDNCVKCSDKLLWGSQEVVLREVMERFL